MLDYHWNFNMLESSGSYIPRTGCGGSWYEHLLENNENYNNNALVMPSWVEKSTLDAKNQIQAVIEIWPDAQA